MSLAHFARRHGHHVRRGLILASLAVIVGMDWNQMAFVSW